MIYRPSDELNSSKANLTGSYDGISSNAAPLNPLTISKYWIWTFRSELEYSNWFHISDMAHTNPAAIIPGGGFTIKGTSVAETVNTIELTFNNPVI